MMCRPYAVDRCVFAEEVGFSGCGVGCGHVIACDISLFSVRADLRVFMETSKQYLCIEYQYNKVKVITNI